MRVERYYILAKLCMKIIKTRRVPTSKNLQKARNKSIVIAETLQQFTQFLYPNSK